MSGSLRQTFLMPSRGSSCKLALRGLETAIGRGEASSIVEHHLKTYHASSLQNAPPRESYRSNRFPANSKSPRSPATPPPRTEAPLQNGSPPTPPCNCLPRPSSSHPEGADICPRRGKLGKSFPTTSEPPKNHLIRQLWRLTQLSTIISPLVTIFRLFCRLISKKYNNSPNKTNMRITPELSDEAITQEVGSRLSRARLELNLTQAELAEEAGISKRTLERLEKGAVATQLSALIRVCRVLGLLDRFDSLLPEDRPTPIEQLEGKAQRRRRARGSDASQKTKPWSWDEESTS